MPTNYGMHFEVIYHSNSHAFFKSGMLLSTATEGSAPDVISQLLYKFWILLLYLLCKLLPRMDQAGQIRQATNTCSRATDGI